MSETTTMENLQKKDKKTKVSSPRVSSPQKSKASPSNGSTNPPKEKERIKYDCSHITLDTVLIRLPKPERAEMDNIVKECEKRIQANNEEMKKLDQQIEKAKESRNITYQSIQVIKEELNVLNKEKEDVLFQRNEIQAIVQKIKKEKEQKQNDEKQFKQECKYTNIKDIDDEIARLRYRQETSNMSLMKEKELIKAIEALQATRKNVLAFESKQKESTVSTINVKELNQKLDEKKKLIDNVVARINAKRDELKAEYKKIDEARKANASAESNEGENGKKQLSEVTILANKKKELYELTKQNYDKIKSARNEHKVKLNEYFKRTQEMQYQKKLKIEAEKKQKQDEYEKKLKQYEEELAKLHPKDKEIQACIGLMKYLEKSYPAEVVSEDNNNEVGTTGNNSKKGGRDLNAQFSGLQLYKKNDDDEDFYATPSTKNSKKKNTGLNNKNKKSENEKITMPLVQLELFSMIEMVVPIKKGEINMIYEEIKKKKAAYEAYERKEEDKNTKKTSENKEKESKALKKNTNKKPVIDDKSFPGLPAAPIAPKVVKEETEQTKEAEEDKEEEADGEEEN